MAEKISKEIIKKAEEFALSEIEKYGLPSLINFETSKNKGQELVKKLKANKEIVLLGTMLMDIKLGQAKKEKRPQDHIQMSAEATKEFLSQFNLPSEIKDKIIGCVKEHHGAKKFGSKEGEICANADCYRFIFPKNVFAFIINNVKSGMTLEASLAFANDKLEEKHKILSIPICKKELEPYYKNFKILFKEAMKK